MRKALGLAILGCALVLGFACSGESTTPTTPAVSDASGLQIVTGAAKQEALICHRNSTEDPYGVVVEMSTNSKKTDGSHWKHFADEEDCYIDACWLLENNDVCSPSNCLPCGA